MHSFLQKYLYAGFTRKIISGKKRTQVFVKSILRTYIPELHLNIQRIKFSFASCSIINSRNALECPFLSYSARQSVSPMWFPPVFPSIFLSGKKNLTDALTGSRWIFNLKIGVAVSALSRLICHRAASCRVFAFPRGNAFASEPNNKTLPREEESRSWGISFTHISRRCNAISCHTSLSLSQSFLSRNRKISSMLRRHFADNDERFSSFRVCVGLSFSLRISRGNLSAFEATCRHGVSLSAASRHLLFPRPR